MVRVPSTSAVYVECVDGELSREALRNRMGHASDVERTMPNAIAAGEVRGPPKSRENTIRVGAVGRVPYTKAKSANASFPLV